MKITSQMSMGTGIQPEETPFELKQGDILHGAVKQKTSSNEAIVTIRGRDVQVRFEGSMPPAGEKVNLSVTKTDGGSPQVKWVNDTASQKAQATGSVSIDNTSENYSSEQQQVSKLLSEKGIHLTKEQFDQVKSFLKSAQGTIPQKIETIQSVLQKGLDVHTSTLVPVHEALHGEQLSKVLSQLTSALPSSDGVTSQAGSNINSIDVRAQIAALLDLAKSEPSLQRLLQQLQGAVQQGGELPKELADKLTKLVADAQKLQQAGLEAAARQLITRGLEQLTASLRPNLSAATPTSQLQQQAGQVLTQLDNQETNASKLLLQTKELAEAPTMPAELKSKLEQSLSDARRQLQQGDVAQARKILRQSLTDITSSMSEGNLTGQRTSAETKLSQSTSAQSALPQDIANISPEFAAWAGASNEATKTVIVTHITPKLRQAAEQFKNVKREVTRNLDMVQQIIQNTPRSALPQAKTILESAINTLDKAILKSDAMMLTDMGTEKKLMKASSQLAEARKLLAGGDHSSAVKIVQDVKAQLEQLTWKPADVKIRHLLLKQQAEINPTNISHRLTAEINNITTPHKTHDLSARGMFELVRSMGLNHDSEAAMNLAGQSGQSSDKQENMKSMLMRFLNENGQHPSAKSAEQALTQITGQQLLNKAETGSQQSMYFSFPVPLGDRKEEVKVMINARKEGQRIDWENCTLFFMVDTPKMGPTGIQVSITERQLAVTLKNDASDIEQKVSEAAKDYVPRLQEIGYRVSGMRFAPLNSSEALADNEAAQQHNKPEVPSSPANLTTKGFDFKI